MNHSEQHDLADACSYFFTGKRQVCANEKPRIIFVFSSPGAGKSTHIKPLLEESFVTPPSCWKLTS